MKKVSDYVRLAKASLGDVHMSDRELGVRLGGYSSSAISDARYEKMSDPLAVKIAELLKLPGGELLWAARTAREKDPIVKRHLESWARDVGKALASVPMRTASAVAAMSVALGLMLSPHDAMATVGGAGGRRQT